MNEKLEVYARLLLEKCLNIEKGEPLLISGPIEAYDFIRILSKKAYQMGVVDIYFDFYDDEIKHNALKTLSFEELKNSLIFNKEIYSVYAKKNAAFLQLSSVTPGLMDDVDSKILSDSFLFTLNTQKTYREKQMNDEVSWLIAPVPTEAWAKYLFPKEINPVSKLWDEFLDMCLIKDNSLKEIEEKIDRLDSVAKKLNELQLKNLYYKNSLGTNLKIELHKNALWHSARTTLKNGKKVICNIPSEEVYTVPIKTKTEGVVYSSKPLIYNGKKIDKFHIEFKNGKVSSYNALVGNQILGELINSDEGAKMLGEVALVEYNSPISNKNKIYYNTLLDENASCHIALGEGYSSCMNITNNEYDYGINSSVIHVDFMIGTKDLDIKGINYKGEEYQIFKDGNFDIKKISD